MPAPCGKGGMRTLAPGSAGTEHSGAKGNRTDRPDRPDTLVTGLRTLALALAIAAACVGSVGATPLGQGGGAPFPLGRVEHVSSASSDVRVEAAPEQGASAGVAEAPVVGASGGALVINATFDSSITSDPNSAAIEAIINNAVSIFRSLFNDPITVSILFRYATTDPDGSPLPPGALAVSYSAVYAVPWNTYIDALKADAATANDATANASLSASALSTNVVPSSANGRAVGLNTPPAMFANGSVGAGGPYDGIVTLNSNQPFKFTRPPASGMYDGQRSTEHEMDEILGFGSYLNLGGSDLRPQDLFSWSAAGARNLMASGSRYLSIDSGNANIVGFNQDPSGDFGDWLSGSCPQANPYVQDAFSCTAQASDVTATSPEGINLDVIGYDLITATATTTSLPTTTTTSSTTTTTAPSGSTTTTQPPTTTTSSTTSTSTTTFQITTTTAATSTTTTTITVDSSTTTTLPCPDAGFDGLRCVLHRALHPVECGNATIPRRIQRRLAKASSLIDRGAFASSAKKSREFARKAAKTLKKAIVLTDAATTQGKLSGDCGSAMSGILLEAEQRAQELASAL